MTLQQPEPQVLRAAMKGDARAFRQIVEAYRPGLLRYVGQMVRDRDLAEEIVQEVLLSVYQHLPRFSERCLFTTWLYSIARNEAIDALRLAERRPKNVHASDVDLVERTQPSDPEHNEFVAAIWRAVSELDESLRLPLLLRDVAGLSYREIGDAVGIPLSSVKWRIHRARELVQQALAVEGLTRISTAHSEHAVLAYATALLAT